MEYEYGLVYGHFLPLPTIMAKNEDSVCCFKFIYVLLIAINNLITMILESGSIFKFVEMVNEQ